MEGPEIGIVIPKIDFGIENARHLEIEKLLQYFLTPFSKLIQILLIFTLLEIITIHKKQRLAQNVSLRFFFAEPKQD